MQIELEQLMDLERLDSNLFRNRYHQENFNGSLFGGQVLSQALMACYRTQNTEREPTLPHSLHAYFLRTGKSATPVIYDVESVRDGRTVVSRRVVARQFGRPILNMATSFHYPEDGFQHQTEIPSGIPAPEELLAEHNAAAKSAPMPSPDSKHGMFNPFTIVPIDENLFNPVASHPANAYYWIKTAKPLSPDPIDHYCALAFASDLGLLATSLLPHGISIMSKKIYPASIDHAMWFHSDKFRADNWLLCHCYSPWAGHGRGFAHGSVYTREGKLILSTAQEGLIRRV